MTYRLSTQLRDAILATLKTRPYSEVADGYFALESLHPYEGDSVAIQTQMRDSLIAYLGSLPFEQVRGIIPVLVNLAEVEENRAVESVSEE
jgi:hypothetical protein